MTYVLLANFCLEQKWNQSEGFPSNIEITHFGSFTFMLVFSYSSHFFLIFGLAAVSRICSSNLLLKPASCSSFNLYLAFVFNLHLNVLSLLLYQLQPNHIALHFRLVYLQTHQFSLTTCCC